MTQSRRDTSQGLVRERIKKVLREEPDLSTTFLAERFGVSLTTVRNMRRQVLKEQSKK